MCVCLKILLTNKASEESTFFVKKQNHVDHSCGMLSAFLILNHDVRENTTSLSTAKIFVTSRYCKLHLCMSFLKFDFDEETSSLLIAYRHEACFTEYTNRPYMQSIGTRYPCQ